MALREFNFLWALPVYPIFEEEKSNELDKKAVKQKSHKKNRKNKYNCYKHRLREINNLLAFPNIAGRLLKKTLVLFQGIETTKEIR